MLRAIVWLGLAGVIVVGTWMGSTRLDAPAPAAQTATLSKQLRRTPPVAPVIRVEGEVVGVASGKSGTLTVQVDGKAVRQVAATAGSFVVDVPASRAGMVTLEYVQPGVQFVSPLGSYARLMRMAGADATLTREECECARISAFSTALQHVAGMVLGRPPRSDVELRNAARQGGSDLPDATGILARLAEDPALLPPSHATGLALLRDRPAFLAYLYERGYILFEDMPALLDRQPTATLRDVDLPERIALLGPMLDVTKPTPSWAFVLEREGNAHRMHAPSGSLGVSYLGTATDDAIRMVPDGEIALVNPTFRCPFTNEVTGRHWKLLSQDLRRQWASEGLEIWRMVTESEISFPNCPGYPGYFDRITSFLTAADLANTRLPTNARRFLGRRTLPVFCGTLGQHNGNPLDQCSYAVHSFSRDGSGTIVDLGNKVDEDMQPIQANGRAPFSWSMGSDGAMHVQAGDERARYWVLDGGDGAALGVVYVADAERDSGHFSLAGYTPMIRVGVADTYNANNVPGAWGYATYDSVSTPRLDLEQADIRIVRDASGRSLLWEDGYWGSVERWTTAWGRLYSTSYADPSCIAPSEACQATRVRYFRPLARVGDRVHGIEEMYINPTGSELIPAGSWPQFHERREVPEGEPEF